MRKRVKIALVVVIVAAIGFAVWVGLREGEREPVYQGKSLRVWLVEYHRFSTGRERDAIRAIDTNGIPTLLAMLRKKDSAMKSKLVRLWRRHFSDNPRLPDWLRSPRWVRYEAKLQHELAVVGFNILGKDAGQAVPALVEIFEHRISRDSQEAAAKAILALGPAASNALPSLARACTNSDVGTRITAVTTLADLQAEPRLVVLALMDGLRDPDSHVRRLAVLALIPRGADAQPSLPMLAQMLQDTNGTIREYAAEALARIEGAVLVKKGVNTNAPGE